MSAQLANSVFAYKWRFLHGAGEMITVNSTWSASLSVQGCEVSGLLSIGGLRGLAPSVLSVAWECHACPRRTGYAAIRQVFLALWESCSTKSE